MGAKTTSEYCRRIYSALSGHEELHRGFSLVSWASRTVEERYYLNKIHNGFGCWREDPLQSSRFLSFGYSHWEDFSFLGRSSPGVQRVCQGNDWFAPGGRRESAHGLLHRSVKRRIVKMEIQRSVCLPTLPVGLLSLAN